ncbi:hypothetical protein BWQ96_09699 [Gracilariopsis chorda]|uniref:Lipid-binding serum glycoprotein N-terminal domain-containing protein n=1 Tax=Gracilariopsis chorda TaxID=448386 RepID=A0A2V3IET1_9FLOR|nr:hypothetical protein BWQ96_09699 [Gracilariopsis chorda]|eukprot:PXF40595.1 hypothetical protein BWQ96_09699 [Gracilariopsis chorda]
MSLPARFTLHDGDFAELDESADYETTASAAPGPVVARPALPSAPNLSASSPQPVQHPAQPHQSLLSKLVRRYPSLDKDVLTALLVSCDNDIDAASTLVEGDTNASSADDALLAASLQERENRRASVRHRRNNAVFPLQPFQMDSLVSTLKHIVVPALHAHFEELVLPDTTDQTASILYSLQHVQVTALSLPNVTVRPAPDRKSVFLTVLNAQLELHVGSWKYESRGIVPVNDAGQARLSVQGLTILLKLEPRWSHDGTARINVSECNVTVDGVTRFKTYGAKADWAYSAIALVLKPLVLSYVKEAIADSVSRALALYLRQWSCSRTLDASPGSTASPSATQAQLTAAE